MNQLFDGLRFIQEELLIKRETIISEKLVIKVNIFRIKIILFI